MLLTALNFVFATGVNQTRTVFAVGLTWKADLVWEFSNPSEEFVQKEVEELTFRVVGPKQIEVSRALIKTVVDGAEVPPSRELSPYRNYYDPSKPAEECFLPGSPVAEEYLLNRLVPLRWPKTPTPAPIFLGLPNRSAAKFSWLVAPETGRYLLKVTDKSGDRIGEGWLKAQSHTGFVTDFLLDCPKVMLPGGTFPCRLVITLTSRGPMVPVQSP